MQKRVFFRLVAGTFLLATAFSQDNPDTTIRISVNLVQVDAVVTDSKGKHISDLKADDFEILQDGKPQKITHFSYIPMVPPKPVAPAAPPTQVADRRSPAPPVPVQRLKMNQVRRTIALVVDDLGLSFESMAQVRSSLKKYVEQQMEPGDLVAIVRTGAGMGALQSFTSDKRELYAAIERVKFNSFGRVGVSSFAPLGSAEAEDAATNGMEFRNSAFTVGTLGAIRFIANGLKELPGRKSVVIFSENMKLFNADGMDQWVMDSLRQLTDLCNRASVVLYTIDPRGLPTLSLTAADRPSNPTRPDLMAQQQMARHTQYWDSQEGLSYLAQETGGIFIHDTNDISKGLREVLDDQLGYYLIGYTPDSATFDEKTGRRLFHKVSIKVKRPGMHVRTRDGFFGVPDTGTPSMPRTRDGELQYALSSPFGASGIHLRLTGLFFTGAKAMPENKAKAAPPPKKLPKGKQPPNAAPVITPGGPVITAMLHIDGHDLTFVDEPDDWHKTVIDILAITFGDNGVDVDHSNRTYTIRVHGNEYKRAIENGFVYTIPHPVKKPGAYQLRMAVRDATSEKVGSASQFIEVPDVSKGKLTLSGILVQANPRPPQPAANASAPAASTPAPNAEANPAASAKAAQTEGQQQGNAEESPAMRIFRPGHSLMYAYYVINAQMDHATRKPDLLAQVRLFRDGAQVYQGKPTPLSPDDQPDLKRIFAGGRLQLGSKMQPGDYTLQVVVTDNLAKDKSKIATQTMDFEVKN